jgi:protein associated with RNAse G/E
MVRKAILDLYLNVKIRSQDEIAVMDENAIENEKKKLAPMDTIDIIDYIKQSVEILMHMRIEEFEQFKENWNMQEKFRKA